MAPPPITHAPHVFVASLDAPELDPADVHHLHVLRIAVGETLVVCDGTGAWRTATWTGSAIDPAAVIEWVDPPSPPIAIAFALTKNDKPDLIVQKLTELGVDRIVPFVADRSVVRWDAERRVRNVERLRRIAREAAMQSRRLTVPRLDEVDTFAALTARGFVRADRDGQPPTLARPAIAIGPEGGWSEAERNGPVVRLGPTVLRAETAAMTAAALLSALRAGLIREGDERRASD